MENTEAAPSGSRERVLRAYAFQRPDRVPRFDSFWQFPDSWRERLGPAENLSDMEIWVPNEGAFCTRERLVEQTEGRTVRVDTWGATTRESTGTYFAETLDVAIPAGTDPDHVTFDSPLMAARFGPARDARSSARAVFGKTGGPYLRTTFVRGETQFLTDIAGDPQLARTLADKMADHLAAVGVEAIRRWHLHETVMSIWDDMAFNAAPMFSPEQFERIFLPGYRLMIRAFREAGAPHVFLHSDGNILPLLDMLVDAGIDGLNPLERRAGMDIVTIRKKFPRLILTGGMDNTDTLIHGPESRIVAEAKEIIDLGREGGVIIGTHSISPEIPLDYFAAYDETCRTYGNFSVR
jgi:hypothetical protein